ncbi:hypothetical protein [Pseudomonas sp. RGM2987]|uniref:hypothetical protein n=1 Tax=Pseudomonas sp. RGM2987 TaxID=2930090 RepID=UPI001FD6F246|nr:hypothetical protein [Pseudomonas sp. RGM2987]MCJ8207137.1 hypothetical protein [Pseudomonas sp. RGM2987]
MIPAPEFATDPAARPPAYSRWVAYGLGLLALLVGNIVAIVNGDHSAGDGMRSLIAIAGFAIALLAWMLAFLLRVVYYRLSRHNARCYIQTARHIQQAWWARHRQKATLVESVLLGPGCQTPEHRQALFHPDHPPPIPEKKPGGMVLRLPQVLGDDLVERERQLARVLALQWRAQQAGPVVLQPLRCYWQGSLESWQAFVEQMATSCPQVELPERPEPWLGIRSLDSIIDQLQGAPSDARILCGGCQSSPPQRDGRLPAGEAALMWLFGPEQSVVFSRGEWFDDSESLGWVAERAVQQSELSAPADVCMSFSQPDVPELPTILWNTKRNVQDRHFGAVANLEAMVVQTLAASYAQHHGVPCAWLACDPHYTLALGVVKPHDFS